MDNPSSPLDTLRQLKEMLDAGALTLAEFEALKKRLVFSDEAATPPATPESVPLVVLPPAPVLEQHSPVFDDIKAAPVNETPAVPIGPSRVFENSGNEVIPPSSLPPVPVFSAVPPPAAPLSEPTPRWTGDEFPAAVGPPDRNPLALILSIGGVLVFLAVVLYLSLNRSPSEHISSTSQTAADSLALATPIETGPQATQLLQPVAIPETVRVRPANPAPPVQPRSASTARDSAAVAPSTAADSATGR